VQFINPKPIDEANSNQSITLLERTSYSVGILIDVAKDTEMDLNFEKMRVSYHELPNGNRLKHLNVTVSNDNLFYFPTQLNIEVYNTSGELIMKRTSKNKNIYPGSCREITLDLSDLEAGQYECVLLAKADEQMLGTNLSLSID